MVIQFEGTTTDIRSSGSNLSPLKKTGYIELVDGGNKSSCRSAYRLTGKGREFAKCTDRIISTVSQGSDPRAFARG
jgi:hypothetical protein